MVDLQPILLPNNNNISSNTSNQSNSSSSSPTSIIPSYLPSFVPHLQLPQLPSPSLFPLFNFQEPMAFFPAYPTPYFYYYYYFNPTPITISVQPPPPPPSHGGFQLVPAVEPTIEIAESHGVRIQTPSAFRGKPNRWTGYKRRARKEWKPKQQQNSGHASGSHNSPPPPPPPSPRRLRLPRPSSAGHLAMVVANCTTVMVKNIPNSISRSALINELDSHCRMQNHKAAYDFLYLPFDFGYKLNLGYAFVNFTSVEGASTLAIAWNGKGWHKSPKICEITPAKLQGFEMCKRHFEVSEFQCYTADFLPVEFSPPRDGFNGSACEMTTIGRYRDANAKIWRLKTVIPPRISH
ncbi:hypothetical protein SOVF_121100 [Spinacia oleracea]|uniref:Protein MEI2-like 6 n=1 Tax=Spinacia oleracea TaxID=3562 RepID=A0A9R0IC73_SPIOL|nr:protein MEI2-like 6 [Spinacia oleracea]KNA12870.1 hypothetical protein SOVF_121100 [Spinacia oleracea]